MVDDIQIAALSAKMGVLSISDDLQIALVKTDDGWSGGRRRRRSRYAAGYCPMLGFNDLSRQRLGLFSMPPAATVEADVLKNCGSCHEVNTRFSTKATLALLAAFKVFGVFLSHKDQRLEVLNRFVYQVQPTSLCDCMTA
jgi:hypothetical protein